MSGKRTKPKAPSQVPFKVGDRVRGFRSIHNEWVEGTITSITLGDPIQTYELGDACWVKKGTVTLLEPAPEVTVQREDKLLEEAHAALKASNERVAELTRELDETRADLRGQVTAIKAVFDERDALQAKLHDIATLIRAGRIIQARGGASAWDHIRDGVEYVIAREPRP